MASLTSIERRLLEDALEMSGGLVLDYRNPEFTEAVREATGRDIDDPRYAVHGTSKAKRLRQFWTVEPDPVVARLIQSFIEYADAFNLATPEKMASCWKIVRRLNGESEPAERVTKSEFLSQDYPEVNFNRLQLESAFLPVMEYRWAEVKNCLNAGANLSAIILLGSMLEGVLLGAAHANPREFNQAPEAPKDEGGKVLPLWKWNLAAFIDVAYRLGILKLDVKKFSHALRDFRNYIHPYEQHASGFTPDQDTARICLQVFRAAVNQLSTSTRR